MERVETERAAPAAFVYILECRDGTWYTGWTVNLEHRLQAHNNGKGAKYTRSRLPVRLIYAEEAPDKVSALKREYAIKHLRRREKERLVCSDWRTKLHGAEQRGDALED